MKPHVVAFVFARGGSKGLPRKNLRLLAGKPLLAWSIETARASARIDRVVVSTEDAEIAEVARACGAEVPFMRPAELARDDSPELLAWRHALDSLERAPGGRPIDVFVSVPTTSPLRGVQDVEACIDVLLEKDAATDLALCVTEARRNPFHNMVKLDEEGFAERVLASAGRVTRRQDAPTVYDVTTVAYAARPEFVRRAISIYDGRIRVAVVPPERAIDIDSELDLHIAEALLERAR